MARRPRVQFPGAIYHVVTRGVGRRNLFHDDGHYQRLTKGLEEQGECGGKDPVRAYRRYVAQGLEGEHEDPLKGTLRDWVIGTEEFFKRMVAMAEGKDPASRGRIARRLKAYTMEEILELVAHAHDTDASQYSKFRSPAPGREMAALRCRRYTGCTLAELSEAFGLGHPSSSANLVLAGKNRERESVQFRQKMLEVENMMQPNIEH